MPSPRVLVVSTDPLTEEMPGPAIRAWHLAEVLAKRQEVTLASTLACTRSHAGMRVMPLGDETRRRQMELWADVIVVPAGVLHEWPSLAGSDKVLVVDIYDPYHLENLEPGTGASQAVRDDHLSRLTGAINAHLGRGDFFLCATDRQRDFWLGSLAALGRLNPYTYDEDPNLASLIAVVPFGLPADPPRRDGPGLRSTIAGIGVDDRVILWAGGVYNWLDPLSLLRAVDHLRRRIPEVRLVFLGMQHPNPAVPAMRTASEARALADRLGLTNGTVFFNEGWVPYDRRANFLLDADLGVSTHLDHIETRFSFRTRVLDYLWAGLPTVLTGGDVLSDLVAGYGLGRAVPAGDVDAIEDALASLLLAERPPASRFETLTRGLRWDEVAQPLVSFCTAPRRAPDVIGRARQRRHAVPPPQEASPVSGRALAAEAAAALRALCQVAVARARRRAW